MRERDRGGWWSVFVVLAAGAVAGCSTHAAAGDGAATDAAAEDHSSAIDGGGQPDGAGLDAAGDAGTGDDADGAATVLGPIAGMPVATFDTTAEGFQLSVFPDAVETNLGDLGSLTRPTLVWDPTQGSPATGSLKVSAPFSGANQYVAVEGRIDARGPRDWTGRTAHVRVRVSSGTFSGTAALYVDTTSTFVYGGSSGAAVPSDGAWHELTLDVSHPPVSPSPTEYNPSKVVLVGVNLDTGLPVCPRRRSSSTSTASPSIRRRPPAMGAPRAPQTRAMPASWARSPEQRSPPSTRRWKALR